MADGRSTDFERCPLSDTNQRYFPLFCINSSRRWRARDVRVPCGQCSSEVFGKTFKKHSLASFRRGYPSAPRGGWNKACPKALVNLMAKAGYALPQSFINWVTIAGQNGLKVDLCLAYGNGLYADSYDVTAFANAVAWLARN
jgi:hypothetical protein